MMLPTPHSLRRRLLWLLLLAIVLTATTQAWFAYRNARAEADAMFDYHMQQTALALRSGLNVNGSELFGQGVPLAEENFDFVVQVWTSDGINVFRSTTRAELPQRAILGFSNVAARGTTYRVFSLQSHNQVIQVAQDMAVRQEMASSLALRTLLPIAAMAPVLMLVAWWVVSVSLLPVARVRTQLAQRQPDSLDPVSDVGLPDEITPLVRELNLLLARVGAAFGAQKNFVADAAHELRSPLAALRLQVQGLQRAPDSATRDVALERLLAGIDRATRLVEQLLVLTRNQAQTQASAREPVVLGDITQLEMADATAAANTRHITLGLDATDAGRINGYPDALRILVRNLLDNAIKYTPVGGTVTVQVTRTSPGTLRLQVEDSGTGIAQDDLARVMDRFYRVPGTPTTGSGLGLAIVKSIADLHGATVHLGRAELLRGLLVQIDFPVAAS